MLNLNNIYIMNVLLLVDVFRCLLYFSLFVYASL